MAPLLLLETENVLAGSKANLERLGAAGCLRGLGRPSPLSRLLGPKGSLVAAKLARRLGSAGWELSFLQELGRADEARWRRQWEFAKALMRRQRESLAPMDPALRFQLLSALRDAQASTDRAVKSAASIVLSDLLREMGAFAKSAEAAQIAVDCGGGARALHALADSLIAEGRYGEAHALGQGHCAQPDHTGVGRRTRLAGLLLERGRAAADDSVGTAEKNVRVLLVVGGGVGDILHATPAIGNVARRMGSPVDVLVAADAPGAEFLVRNPQYVRSVWPGETGILGYRYETVFYTHSVGPMRFPLKAERMVAAEQWRRFRPGRLNETLFNLEAAQHLLGITYEPSDVGGYFVGDLVYTPPANSIIGLAAGSKGGRWISKRWPYFPELARRLKARGVRVLSFGMPDEYVEGTEDRTGGTIEQMSRAMLDCSGFVSNDSGPMHIASALGIPVLALFAPTDAFTHLPLRQTTAALALDKPCAPCEVKEHSFFASGNCRCIAEISAAAVEEELLKWIGRATVAEARDRFLSGEADTAEALVE